MADDVGAAPRTIGQPPRSPGPSVQDILRREALTQAVPPPLLQESFTDLGRDDLAADRYTSHAFHRAEVEKVWGVAWQLACREEDLPEIGDQWVYEIAERSVLLVRSGPDEIQAFHNVCLHRGRLLRTQNGFAPAIRCPFHGWAWNLDGTLKTLPADWDFPQVEKAGFCLPKVAVGRWDGFVFVSLADEPTPFAEVIRPLAEHFAHWPSPPNGRRKAAHVAAVVDCNWKVAMEAFIEGYHGPTTHPQMAHYVGDVNTQYDSFGDHVSRMVTAQAVPSPVLGRTPDAVQVVRAMAHDLGFGEVEVKPGDDPRTAMADHMRRMASAMTGADMSGVSNAAFLEAVQYHFFPNIMPWVGVMPMVYRFRPNGDDPDSCIAELMLLVPAGPNGEGPERVPVRWLPRNPDWREAHEFGALGPIFNQDMQNLPYVQRGLKAAKKPGVTISVYQESRIRHFHATLDKYIQA